ncbi:MAG: hypothetical protein EHM33_33310 [Chloroflexi bacterium]|nr:MAG: hypothetical protein EHM33_33310 [Chloroflexota bacterium]
MTDREAIENLMHDMNLAFTEFESRDRLLSTKAEQAIKTLNEIGDLRDVNWTTFTRRREAYVEAMAKLRDSKDTNVAIEGNSNVVKIA